MFTSWNIGNVCIVINFFPVCDVINFEINVSNQAVFLHDKKSGQKFIILRIKRAFKVKLKAVFIILKGLSVAKNCLRECGFKSSRKYFFHKGCRFCYIFFFLVNIIVSVNLICLVIFCLYFEVVTQYDVGHLCIF